MGSGVIECPVSEDMFFLPQQPFMPLGTLRQQLLFPSGISCSSPQVSTAPPLRYQLLFPSGTRCSSPQIPASLLAAANLGTSVVPQFAVRRCSRGLYVRHCLAYFNLDMPQFIPQLFFNINSMPGQWERVAMELTCLVGNSAFVRLIPQSA